SCDPEVARYVLWNAHRSLGDSRDYLRFVLRQYRNGEPSVWGIVSKDSGRVIGTIGYMTYVWENLTVEVGYSLARSHWNRGLMTEALQAVIDATFQNIYIHRIEAQHDVRNPASGRVMARCGMQYEGLLRDRVFNKNHFVDISLYAILYDDWKKARQAKTNVPPGSA
ncbi:MAG: GNAT family N-acetyltransferase, partial [bacterium]|nr:GNAT family N-acetyltransferase [bacterium]